MKKIIIGLVLGILITLAIKTAYASGKIWDLGTDLYSFTGTHVEKIQDGRVTCYIVQGQNNPAGVGISCLK